LLEKGRYAEAKAASVRALVLLPQRHRLRAVISKVVKGCERFLKWQERLPRLLDGADKAGSAREWLEVVYVCQHKGMHAGAARFATQAFALDPKLADDLQAGRRYNAACHAALAAAGKGEDAARLDDAAKAKLRRQALDWLKADLAVLTRLRDSGPPQTRPFIVQTLTHWLQDTDLAGIRDKAALAKLPAQEQKAFTQLWADVAGLLKKATATLGAFLQQKLPEARKALGKDNPQLARLLAQIGMGLLEEKKWVEAEPLLRESLAIRAKARPDSWVTFNTRSMLGGALLGQEKYAEAEPLLLKGQAGMKEREKTIPRQDKERLSEAVQRLVQLYEATGKKDEAAKWRKELEKLEPPAGPGNKS
jgi:tetratricopeptide (TPR) repeat protein